MAELVKKWGEDDAFADYLGTGEELRRVINASRKRAFHIRSEVWLPTTEGRGFSHSVSVEVTQRVAMKLAEDFQAFRERRAAHDPSIPEADLPKIGWTVCSNIIFIG